MLLWWICSIVCDYTSLIKYLYATWCGSKPLECSYVLPWINTVVFYQLILCQWSWRIIQLDNNDGVRDATS
jgi:hypothetical protein